MQQQATNSKLSKRETQIMEHIATGAFNNQIAESLFIAESTVKFHCSNIYRKLGIKNRIELIINLNSQSRAH
jgi:DNA-binding NarL/FixJ family response regulator